MNSTTDSPFNERVETPELGSSTPSVPPESGSVIANTLFKWLGSFWSDIYEDDGFAKSLQSARSLRAAQLYLDILEAANLKDRSNAPVFHRERWYPIVVRRSWRNTSKSTALKLGSKEDAKLGDQNPNDEKDRVYPKGTVFRLGGKEYSFKDIVVYPVSTDIKKIPSCIVDNIAAPKVVLHSNTDFLLMDGALALVSKYDPFGDGSPFPKFELDPDDPDGPVDYETVLWASDALFDKDLVYGHLGYAIGLPTESTELYKRVVNAVWNTVSDGAAPRMLKALLAAICGVPTIRNEKERVEQILRLKDRIQVVTDKEVYTLNPEAELRPSVKPGSVLGMFDTIESSVKVYPYVTDTSKMEGYTEFADKFESDVPVLDLPPAFFRSDVEDGFSVGWDERDIVCHGFDKNGNPKLSFQLEGSELDNDIFWGDVWSTYEDLGVSMESCFDGYLDDTLYADGKTVGRISPIKFFLRHLVGANTLIITIRTDTIADDAPLYDPKFFATVRECIPSYVRLFFIEHESVRSTKEDGYEYDMEDASSEEEDVYAFEESFDEARLTGKRGFRAKDAVNARFVAKCRDDYDDID